MTPSPQLRHRTNPPAPTIKTFGRASLQGIFVVIFGIAAGFLLIAGVLNAIGTLPVYPSWLTPLHAPYITCTCNPSKCMTTDTHEPNMNLT